MKKQMFARVVSAIVLFLLVLSAGMSRAQSGRSWMKGMIFADSSVQGLPGALVELTGEATNERLREVHLSARANQDGWYSLEEIPYGEYTFKVSAEGYSSYEIPLYIGSDMLTQIHVKLSKK